MNKKYLPSAYHVLNYFIHGVGCSILGQAVIKALAAAQTLVMASAISAALGLGRLIALPFAGPLPTNWDAASQPRSARHSAFYVPDWTYFRFQQRRIKRLSSTYMCNRRYPNSF